MQLWKSGLLAQLKLNTGSRINTQEQEGTTRDITDKDVWSAFDEKTFSRGYGYFTGHHVETGLKTGNTLTGKVVGTAFSPYKVEVYITDNIISTCTCPVETMCKHGAALLLQWIHDKESIIDIDQLMVWLEKGDKEELIDIIHSMIKDAPHLALDVVSFQKVKENKINIDEISKRLCIPDLEYFSPSEIIESFEGVEEIACMLVKEQQFKKAAQVYLLLVEKGHLPP